MALIVALVWLLVGPTPADPRQEAATTLLERGIMQGYADGSFAGARAITRSELVKTLESLDQALTRQHADLATKKELRKARSETKALGDENESLQKRVTELEDETDLNQRRADEFWF